MRKPKNILIFSTAYLPFVAGAEVAIKEITDRLGKSVTKKIDFDLITAQFDPKLPKIEKVGNVNIYRIGVGKPIIDKLLLPFWGAVKAFKLSKQKEYLCFWGIMVTYATGAAYICNLLRKIFGRGVDSEKVPIVLTLQEGDSEEHLKYRWAGLIALSWKMALKYTDFLTGLSSFLIHRAEKSGYEGRSALIPNGVDLRVFSRKILKKDYLEMIQKMGKNPEDIFLVTTSRLNHKNAVDDIISSLALLPDNIYLLVIGIGSEMSKLKAQAIKLGLGKRVKFLGFLPHPEIPKYFSICDIFVRPSRSEGFGNSFIEAMAARLPVIATPVGGIPDFLDDKETGLFCAPDNPKSLAQAIRLLLEDGVLRERIINKAFTRVTERYSWEYVAKEMKEKVFDII